jgi:hypothetical protein
MKTIILRVAALLVCVITVAIAQVPAVRQGSFEVGGFIGSSFGLDHYQVMGGGNVSYGVTKYLLPYVEYSYFPGIERQSSGTFPTTGASYTVSQAIPFSDFHGGVHIRIPIRESRLVPYAVIGFGGLKSYARTGSATFQGVTIPLSFPSETDFAVNGGGGLRYYIGQRYGVRFEAKVYKPYGGSTGFNDPFGKVEFGFFFQLH